jgi:hypothetical protein
MAVGLRASPASLIPEVSPLAPVPSQLASSSVEVADWVVIRCRLRVY